VYLGKEKGRTPSESSGTSNKPYDPVKLNIDLKNKEAEEKRQRESQGETNLNYNVI